MDNMMSDVKLMVNMAPVGDHVGHRSVQRRCVGLARGVGRPRNLEGMMGMMVVFLMVMVMVMVMIVLSMRVLMQNTFTFSRSAGGTGGERGEAIGE